MIATRSNNDVEGWHHGLHRHAAGRQNLNLYLLIDLLHQEARLTAPRIRLVSEKKLTRIQRKMYRSMQAKIFELWEDYQQNRRSAEQLLQQCAHLNGADMITCASRRTVGNSLASNGRECIIYTTPYHSGGKPAHTFTTLLVWGPLVTGMHCRVKLLTSSPQIVSKKSYLSILVNDEF